MERNTLKPASSAGFENSFLCRICLLPLSLTRNARNSAASLLLSEAIAQTVTQAMLATSRLLAMASADSCCHDSNWWPADLSSLKKHSICQRQYQRASVLASIAMTLLMWAIPPILLRLRTGCDWPPNAPQPVRRGRQAFCLFSGWAVPGELNVRAFLLPIASTVCRDKWLDGSFQRSAFRR